MMKIIYFIAAVGVVAALGVIIAANFSYLSDSRELESSQSQNEIMITNGIKHIVPLDKIKSGGPPKDGIPSIDDPKFVDAIGRASCRERVYVLV